MSQIEKIAMKPRGERAVPRKRGSPRRRHCPVLVCAWIFPATCICLASCASHRDHVGSVREAYFAGNLVDADRHIEKQLKQHKHEADAFLLDKAMLELAAGRPKNSERILRGVRDRFDHLEEKDAGEFTISMLTDDTRRAYAGEDYEKVLIRIMLSLSNVMSGGGDAGAYALQVVEKQQQIIASVTEKSRPEEADQPRMELAYKQLALGPYIRAMLAEESPLTQDEVTRARVQVANWEPNFRDAKADLQRAKFSKPVAKGYGTLYVFALVGRGPIKQEHEEIPTQAALFVADRILNSVSNRSLPPTLAPVKVPQVVKLGRIADAVCVRVDGDIQGQTATIADIGTMAVRQQEARQTEIIARAVARRVMKKGAIYAVQELTDIDKGSPLSLAATVAGIAWEATENADTRCWGLLPDVIQVLRIELAVGDHDIGLRPVSQAGEFESSANTTVTINDGRNSYVMGILPAARFVGSLLKSGGIND